MNLITSFPKYSNGDLNAAFIREIKNGFQLERAQEEYRVKAAAAEAAAYKGAKTVKGLGKHVAEMPARDYWRLRQKYGADELHSKAFIHDFQKRFPHLSTAKV